ncbi:MAG: SOS response-associated peptidase [Microbacteriaceae bacterium]
MCGRFAVDSDINDLIEEFVADGGSVHDWAPSYNIAPTDPVPVVLERVTDGTRERSIELGRWSLVPSWSKQLTLKFPTFNARSETVSEKASFRASVGSKRAIIPARGYYEWLTEGTTKTPHFIGPADGNVAFAALYSWWRPPSTSEGVADADWMLTATMLTMAAVPEFASIHDRNPVMLPRDWWDDWLNPEVAGDQHFVDAAVEASRAVASALEFHRVGPVRGDGPELIRPIDPIEPPALF